MLMNTGIRRTRKQKFLHGVTIVISLMITLSLLASLLINII